MDHPLLQAENVSVRYDFEFELTSVSFKLSKGHIYSLLGESGSGKSSLLQVIGGHQMPHSGRFLLNGQDITLLPPGKRGAATVFQDCALFPHLTAAENIRFPVRFARGHSNQTQQQWFCWLTEAFEITHLLHHLPHELSGGQRQRVAIARALNSKPQVLLLDEPTASLGDKEIDQLRSVLGGALSGTLRTSSCVLVATHNKRFAQDVSDHFLAIERTESPQQDTARNRFELRESSLAPMK